MRIGEQIKNYRKTARLTQEQVANYLGVSTPAVNKWEKGNTYPDISLLPALARLLKWETGSNMPDISILVDIADYYDISIPEIINGERKSEIMNEEERKIAKTMSDYATTEKEKIFKEMKIQSIMGVCALVLYWILHETDAYIYSDALEKLTGYCETLVSVSVIMMAAYTTGSLSKLRSKSWKVFMIENLPKPVRLIVSAVVAFCGAAMIKLALVHFFGL